MSQVRLGELMLASRLIDQDQLQLGLREWRATQEPLSICLSRKCSVDATELFNQLAKATGVPRHKVFQGSADVKAHALASGQWAKQNRAIPLCYSPEPKQLIVVIANPTETAPIDYINEQSDVPVRAELVSDQELNLIFEKVYGQERQSPPPLQPERIPSSAFVSNDPLQASSMVIQDMEEMRNQLHQPDGYSAAGHRSATRGLSMKRENSPIPLPTDALIPMPEITDWLSEVHISGQLSQAIEAVFELCIKNGLFTREEYLERLNTEIDAR